MKLENYGYKVISLPRTRRSALGRAVKRVGYSKVRNALSSRKYREANGSYRFKRYRADLNWLKSKSKYV